MRVKEFLKPEWKKFVLPVVFIVFFLIIVGSFYYIGSVLDKYGCQTASLITEASEYGSENELKFNQTFEELGLISQNMQTDLEAVETLFPILNFFLIIDPIFPVPCTFMAGFMHVTGLCEYYISEETYNCFGTVNPDFSSFFEGPKIKEYQPASLTAFGLNILLLFVEGYLISAVVLFIYRKIRGRGSKTAVLQPPIPKASRIS